MHSDCAKGWRNSYCSWLTINFTSTLIKVETSLGILATCYYRPLFFVHTSRHVERIYIAISIVRYFPVFQEFHFCLYRSFPLSPTYFHIHILLLLPAYNKVRLYFDRRRKKPNSSLSVHYVISANEKVIVC